MKKYIGCDMHKRYPVFVAMDEQGRLEPAVTVANDLLELRSYLARLPAGAPIAVEASGGWYWFVDELEQAGLEVHLVNPLEAKKGVRGRNKTDKLDAAGLAMLLRNGTLPEVWTPPAQSHLLQIFSPWARLSSRCSAGVERSKGDRWQKSSPPSNLDRRPR